MAARDRIGFSWRVGVAAGLSRVAIPKCQQQQMCKARAAPQVAEAKLRDGKTALANLLLDPL
jgi:hypothetical protein